MGTTVTIEVVHASEDADAAIDRAFEWFHTIEQACTRFDDRSELMQLTRHAGHAVAASPILFEAVRFALHVAEDSGGAFDPTVGHRMSQRGFNREHRTGALVDPAVDPDDDVSYRDVRMDAEHQTITLLRPLLLDLGAVAKGLAVDVAARELQPFRDFAVDAGGDVYVGGHNAGGERWSVGIRHPRLEGATFDALTLSDAAVCTSGDYERRNREGEHHILDPRSGTPSLAVASATVVASSAMMADALATAAFVLGPIDGIRFLERHDVRGLMLTTNMDRFETAGWRDE